MSDTLALPPLPEGFTLDEPKAEAMPARQPVKLPPLPEGFALDPVPGEAVAAKLPEPSVVDKVGQPITEPKQVEDMAAAQGLGVLEGAKNLAKGIGERIVQLEGGAVRGIATTLPGSDPVSDFIYWATGREKPANYPTPEEVTKTGQEVASQMENVDLGFEEGDTWEDVKKAPASKFLPWAFKQGLLSAPDMALAMASLPGYAAIRSGELAQERAENDQRTDATVEDMLKTAPAAVVSGLLDRIGGRAMFGLDDVAVQSLKQVPKEVAKAGVKEGLTEGAQEGIESVATTAGTEKGFDAAQTAEQMLAGSLAGGVTGGAVRAGTGTIEAASTTDTPVEGDQSETVETAVLPSEAPVAQDDGGEVDSPLASSPSSIPPEERAILRRTSMPDEDIDAMSPEERAVKVAEARAAGIRVNGAMVRQAEQYQAPQPEPAPETIPIPEERPVEQPVDAKAASQKLIEDYQTRKARDQQMDAEAEQRVQSVSPELSATVLRSVYEDTPQAPLPRPETPVEARPDPKAIAARQIAQYQARNAQADQALAQIQPELESSVRASVAEDAAEDARVDQALGAPLAAQVQRSLYEDKQQGAAPIARPLAPTLGGIEGDLASEAAMRAGNVPAGGGFPTDGLGRVKKPDSLIEFIARRGGIQEVTGELKSLGLTDRKTGFVVGAGPLVRARGVHPDKALEAATQAGYLPEGSTIDDLYEAMAQDARTGRQQFAQADMDWGMAWRDQQGAEARQAEVDAAEAQAYEDYRQNEPSEADRDRQAVFIRLLDEGYAGTMGDDFSQRVARYASAGESFEDAVFYAYDEMRKEALSSTPGMPEIPFFGDEDNEAFARATSEGSESAEAGGFEGDDAGSEVETERTVEPGAVRGESSQEAVGDGRGTDDDSRDRESPGERKELVTEAGADGLPQAVIPGAERAPNAVMAQRKADAPLKPKVAQKDVGGLFSDEMDQRDLLDLPAQPPRKDPPAPSPQPEPEKPEKPEEPNAKIEDFGETLHGARKHIAQRYREVLSDDTIDIAAEPLSKSFPTPDYKSLAQEGVAPEALAVIAVMRDTIPTKPKKPWKLREWVAQVRRLRIFANDILEAEKNGYKDFVASTVLGKMEGDNYSPLRDLASTAKAIASIDPDKLTQAAKWRVEAGSFSMLRSQRFSPSKRFYYIKDDKKRYAERDGYYETEEEAISRARELIRKAVAPVEGESQRKYTPVGVFQDRRTNEIFVGFKGRREVIRIKSGFENAKAAREYINESRDEIQDKIDELREDPKLRRDKNDPRIGQDWREGDVTPESFSETFGFRGVQFGNYVEGPRRQADLNRAFDALMDLADALGIPPRAISLEGRLGLAFGARGHGGKNAAAAHYEPGNVVINLTKEAGPGSLAHEWLHALDNYFGRQNTGGSYVSDSETKRGDIRDEVFQAWTNVRRAIRAPGESGFLGRAQKLDAARSKDYYSTTIELAARSFERYIVDRLETKGAVNDYLANIDLSGGAYPNDAEMKAGITAAYDHLFDTIETETKEDGKVRLYSASDKPVRTYKSEDGKKRDMDLLTEVVQRVAGVDPKFADTLNLSKQGSKLWGREGDAKARGQYNATDDVITLALDLMNWDAANHEAFHRLQNKFLTDRERAALKSDERRLRQFLVENGEKQANVDKMARVEVEAEAFAKWVAKEDQPAKVNTILRRAWGRLAKMLRQVRNLLTGRGFKTYEDIFGEAKEGKIKERQPREKDALADPEDAVLYSIVDRAPDQPIKPKSAPAPAKPKARFSDRLAIVSKAVAAKAKSKGGKYDRITEGDDETFGDFATRKVLDYLDPVLKMQQKVGVDLNDLSDAYLTARLAEGTIRHELHQVDEKYVQPAIKELAAVGATEKDLHEYLYAMHAPERNRVVGLRNETDSDLYKAATDPSIRGASGMSTNEAKQTLADLAKDRQKFMGIRRAASHIRAMLDDGLKRQLKAGLINKATYDELTQQWQHYVPLRAESDTEGTGGGMPSKSRGFDVRGDEFKGATGRYTKADNVVNYAVNNAEQSIIRAEKNKAATAALRFINQFDPEGESIAKVYWSEDPEKLGDITKAPPVYKRVIGKDGKVENRKVNAFQMKDDVLAAKVGGKVYFMQFADPKVGLALKKMTFGELGATMKMLRTVSNWQSLINTRANPAFIPINFLRDVQTGATLAMNKDFKAGEIAKMVGNIPNAWGALWRDARGKPGNGKWDKIIADFKAAGGKISFDQYNSIEDTAKKIQKDLQRASSQGIAGKTWRGFIDLVENLNDTIENGMRVAVFNAAIERGQTPKRAAFLARDLTVDFQKKGEITPHMNALYTFFNASVQGNTNFAKALYRSRKIKVAMGALIMAGYGQHVLNMALAGEDDDGENAYLKMLRNEPWTFERNIVLFIPGSKEHIKLPLGFGMNAFWHLGAQAGAITTGDKSFLAGTLDSTRVAFEAFNPLGSGGWVSMALPTVIDPIWELGTNQNFAGNPIYPQENQFDPAPPPKSEQAFKSTSPAARWGAETLNKISGGSDKLPGAIDVYPDSLEYLWGWFTGGVGRFASQTVETAQRGVELEFEPKKTPFIRSFYGQVDDQGKRSEYFAQREKVQYVKGKMKEFQEAGDEDGLKEFMADHEQEKKAISAFDTVEKKRRELNKQRRKLENREGSADQLKKLDEIELDYMNKARKVFFEAGKTEP